MLELLGLLGGGIMRLVPMAIDFFKQGRDLKYELLRMKQEAELERLRSELRKEEIAAVANAAEQSAWAAAVIDAVKNAIPPQLSETGSRWLNFFNIINISVRAVLTYWWCLCLYTTYKMMIIWTAIGEKVPTRQLADIVCTDFDRAVIGSIIGFWFVDRVLRTKGV